MSVQVKKKRFKSGEMKEMVLDGIADFLIGAKGYPGPSLPVVVGLLMKLILSKGNESVSEQQVTRVLKNLERKEIIHIEEKGEKTTVWIKTKGEPLLLEYSIKKLLDFKKKKKKWNKKWYLVFFDVPEAQRNKRDYLRKFLLKLGFYPYQKSVYLFPYECEEEIILIKKMVEGAKYMKYVIAEKIEDEPAAKTFFNI